MAIVISGNVGTTSSILIIAGIIFTTAGSLIMKRGKSVREQVYYPPYK
jgi:hypothetical protein